MRTLGWRVLLGILGLAATLAWWSFTGDSSRQSTDRIPTRVWDGGGGTVTVEVELSHPGRVSAIFGETAGDFEKRRVLEAWQKLDAGTHSFVIELPRDTVSGSLEASVEKPPVGAVARVTLRGANGTVKEWRETLERPLEPDRAFFAQLELDDWAQALLEGERSG